MDLEYFPTYFPFRMHHDIIHTLYSDPSTDRFQTVFHTFQSDDCEYLILITSFFFFIMNDNDQQVNCILLGNIVWVLFKKLGSSPQHFRTALKATLFLIPVFGIHYMFYMTRMKIKESCEPFQEFLFYLGIAIDCLQGAFVTTIFCLLNAEVRFHNSVCI